MKILFACPILDIRYEWFNGFIGIWKQLREYSVEIFMPYRKPVHIADMAIARKAIEDGFDYVLRMDDDVWDVPSNAVEELMKADKDFISCVMYANGFPYQRCAGVRERKDETLGGISKDKTYGLKEASGYGVIPVDMSAFPFTLIKTGVFRKIPPPWFEHTEEIPSDSYFCQKMLDNGIQPYVHMGLQVTHRGVTYWNRIQRFLADCEFMISTGQMDKNHREFNLYLSARDKLLNTYNRNINDKNHSLLL